MDLALFDFDGTVTTHETFADFIGVGAGMMADATMGSRPVALITRACSGIGAACADCFARDSRDVVLVSRDLAALEQRAQAIRAHGADTFTLRGDLADPGRSRPMLIARCSRENACISIAWATGCWRLVRDWHHDIGSCRRRGNVRAAG
ncbi:SDR family NAD(P)-dependent oxidoreductase [Xanthomonas fragariae]